MKGYIDSLRGYGYDVHKRDNFTCQYCGYNGRSFKNWLQLTIDHIVPAGQGGSHDKSNLITVCHACNSITSRMKINKHSSKKNIIDNKKSRVTERQADYREFWKAYVK